MYNVDAAVEMILNGVKQTERQRLFALALEDAQAMGAELTGELYDKLEEAVSLQFRHLQCS